VKKDFLIFLKHILESIELIEDYVKDTTEEKFLSNPQQQDAVIRRIERYSRLGPFQGICEYLLSRG